MGKLKVRADDEQAKFEAEWKGLGKLIEEDRKRKGDFMKRESTAHGAGASAHARGDMARQRPPRPLPLTDSDRFPTTVLARASLRRLEQFLCLVECEAPLCAAQSVVNTTLLGLHVFLFCVFFPRRRSTRSSACARR